jgi:CSLREA domain-containing protein
MLDLRGGIASRLPLIRMAMAAVVLLTPVGFVCLTTTTAAGAAPLSLSFVVTTTADLAGTSCGSPCSLRQAIGAANAGSGNRSIRFGVNGHFRLTSGAELHVSGSAPGSIAIAGNGPTRTVIDAGGTSRAFEVDPGAVVNIADVAVEHGGNVDEGGGIFNAGTLTVSRSIINANSAALLGGGVRNDLGGTLALVNSSVVGNSAPGVAGGGIASKGVLNITTSTIARNESAGPGGGGGLAVQGTTTLTKSAVTGNTAVDHGGGIAIGFPGTLLLDSTLVASNTVTGAAQYNDGGGIANYNKMTLVNSLVSGNRAGSDGGGIANEFGAAATLTNTVVTFNTATGNGGGIANETDPEDPIGPISLTRSVILLNTAGVAGGGIFAPSGSVTLALTTVAANAPNDCRPAGRVIGCTH